MYTVIESPKSHLGITRRGRAVLMITLHPSRFYETSTLCVSWISRDQLYNIYYTLLMLIKGKPINFL